MDTWLGVGILRVQVIFLSSLVLNFFWPGSVEIFFINYFLGKFCFLLLPPHPLPHPPIHNFSNSPSFNKPRYCAFHKHAKAN